MSSHMPPVPPAGRSPKGPGSTPEVRPEVHKDDLPADAGQPPRNTAEQGQQGNSKQNTTHQGYQQDR